MSAIGDLVVNLVARTKQFTGPLQGAAGSLRSLASRASAITGIAAAAVGGLSAAGAVAWGVGLAVQAEQAEISFKTMLGSASAAKQMLGELSQFAATTPYESPEVIEAAKKLLAYGVEAENISSTLRMLGDVASGVGAPLGDIAYLFGTAKTQGRLFAEDVNQFTNRGIPIIKALAATMGIAEGSVKQLVSEGKVGFPELQAAMEYLTAEGSQFGGMMAAQSQSVAGLWSTLKDNLGMTLRQIAEQFMGAFDVKGVMGDAIAGLEGIKTAAMNAGPYIAEIGGIARAVFDSMRTVATNALTAITSMFGESTGSWSAYLLDTLRFVRVFAETFPDMITAGVLGAISAVYGFGADFLFLFTDQLPAAVGWFSEHWAEVFQDVGSFVGAIFKNLFDNIRSGFAALWAWMKSGFQGSLNLDWRPLTAGFESAISEMPNIPKRPLSGFERELNRSADQILQSVGEKFAELNKTKIDAPSLEAPAETLRAGAPALNQPNPEATADRSPNFAAALSRGSQEAMDVINRAAAGGGSSPNKKLEEQGEKHLKLQQEMVNLLRGQSDSGSMTEEIVDFGFA